jgi:two-component system, NtrC family, sensor kinase
VLKYSGRPYLNPIEDHGMKTLKDLRNSLWPGAGRKKQDRFKQALNEFSRSLTLIVDLEQLKDNVISVIRDIVRVDSLSIFLLNLDLNRFQLAEARGFEPRRGDQTFFIQDDPLIRWFSINETHLVLSSHPDIFSFFAEREQLILRETGVDFIFPLMSMNRLIGLVCFGPKSSGEELKGEEIELLKTLLGQAALAFENAYLYQQQKTRLKKMYRADRLATLGQLAAGAAHEIRNPLTSIRSTIQYLQKGTKDAKKLELVGELIGEVDRINGIIEGLLSFSRPTRPEIKAVDLEALLRQTLTLVETTAAKMNVRIALDFSAPNTAFKADPALLKQVFLNIIMNSLEALAQDGDLRIRVELISKTAALSAETRSFYYILFEDTGPGIPQVNLEKIFDPFFTTKKEGTGLGLSISYGIIQQHGGDIEIESVTREKDPEKHGTRVMITLPVAP